MSYFCKTGRDKIIQMKNFIQELQWRGMIQDCMPNGRIFIS
ncbi:MAG: hypothetical protein Q4B43_08240 [Bacteroidota bacterium]|nr:hypothetical protein [Bacteroidota bacterium]